MSGGWAGSNRHSRLPPNWEAIRQQVLRRDRWRCQWVENGAQCGARANQVDHIKPKTDDHSLEALQSLCEKHHRLKSAREGAAAFHAIRRANRARFARKPEQHPGAVAPGKQSVPWPWQLGI